MDFLTLFMSRTDNTKGCAPIDGRERTRVAVMDDRITIVDQRSAMLGHTFVDLHIFISNALGFGENKFAQGVGGWRLDTRDFIENAIDCPSQIYGCGTRGLQGGSSSLVLGEQIMA